MTQLQQISGRDYGVSIGFDHADNLEPTYNVPDTIKLFVELEETQQTAGHQLRVMNCWATPENSSAYSARYYLVADTCGEEETDSTVKIHQTQHRTCISFESFVFIENTCAKISFVCEVNFELSQKEAVLKTLTFTHDVFIKSFFLQVYLLSLKLSSSGETLCVER